MTQNRNNLGTVKFIGEIKTVEPLTVVLKDVSNNRKHTMPKTNDIPFMPASSLRGTFRHVCHSYINDMRKRNGQTPFNLNQMFMLAQGYFVDQNEEKIAINSKSGTTTQVDLGDDIRNVNPFMSLFGRWGLDGKLGIGAAYASSISDCQYYHGGFRGILFDREPELIEDLDENDVDRLKDILAKQTLVAKENNELDSQIRKLRKEAGSSVITAEKRKELNDKISNLEQQKKDNNLAKGEATQSIRRPIDSIEAICEGVVLSHRMQIENATDIELGLFLTTLGSFAKNSRFGGKKSSNFGLVHCNWTVKVWNEDDFSLKDVGTVMIDDNGLTLEGDMLIAAQTAWREADGLDFTRYI